MSEPLTTAGYGLAAGQCTPGQQQNACGRVHDYLPCSMSTSYLSLIHVAYSLDADTLKP